MAVPAGPAVAEEASEQQQSPHWLHVSRLVARPAAAELQSSDQ